MFLTLTVVDDEPGALRLLFFLAAPLSVICLQSYVPCLVRRKLLVPKTERPEPSGALGSSALRTKTEPVSHGAEGVQGSIALYVAILPE